MTSPPVTPSPAATVLLVRDGATGLEVFMLKRHIDSDFVGGAYVFPGGKVDDADLDMPEGTITPGLDEFGIAGVRETFEESGVLLARRGGFPVSAELVKSPGFQEARRRLASLNDHWDWRPWLVQQKLTLDKLPWLAWWVTPEGVRRRFDTRFYVALCRSQHANHDNVETVDSMWIRPKDALAAQHRNEVSIILPTRKSLAALASLQTAQDALDYASCSIPERIEPTILHVNGVAMADHASFDHLELV